MTRPLVGKKVSTCMLELVLVSVNSERFSANMSDYFRSLEGDAMQEQQLATIEASFQTELYNRTSRILRFLPTNGRVTSLLLQVNTSKT